jgi:hypothetical protein
VKAGFVSQRESPSPTAAAEQPLELQQKRAHFEISPAPEGAPDVTNQTNNKKTKTNKGKGSTDQQAPKLIQQSTGKTNPQLQLTPARETEPDPKATDQTNHAGWNGKANQSSASLKQ